jgi:hypothetical protein
VRWARSIYQSSKGCFFYTLTTLDGHHVQCNLYWIRVGLNSHPEPVYEHVQEHLWERNHGPSTREEEPSDKKIRRPIHKGQNSHFFLQKRDMIPSDFFQSAVGPKCHSKLLIDLSVNS